MATEVKSPDGLITQTGLTGALSTIQDDPDSPDGNWMTSSASNGVLRLAFPTPTGNPTTGTDVQNFKLWVRKDASGGGTPIMEAWLRETGGSTDLELLSGSVGDSVTSDTGQLFTYAWDASNLGTADGSAVEIYIVLTKGGGGPNERNVEFGAVEWNVDYSAGTFTGSAAPTIGGATTSATASFSPGTKTATAAPSAGGVTASATASHTAPVYDATAAPSVGSVSGTASATSSEPTYTGTANPSSGGASCSASATFTAPVYTATSASTTGGATATASATFSPPVYTASVATTSGGATMSATATFTAAAAGVPPPVIQAPIFNPIRRRELSAFALGR